MKNQKWVVGDEITIPGHPGSGEVIPYNSTSSEVTLPGLEPTPACLTDTCRGARECRGLCCHHAERRRKRRASERNDRGRKDDSGSRHKRGWCGGQEDAGRRQTEWKLQMKEEQVKPWQQTHRQTDWIRKKYYLVRQAHWKLSECCGTWQEPSVQEHTLSLHQSAGLGGSEVSLQTGDPFSWTQLESDTRFKRESF
ncbi:hypothetical protein O3P69_019091 [Scylla paramamosain]|uniref:Uncharacterized protein n=1 Tax=Scylla paramamosain TaxID=85552 RepID=A0AAW0SCB0_SCYPA